MNIIDLYEQLEQRRSIAVRCSSLDVFYTLRANIFRARRRFQQLYADLGDACPAGDGFQLITRFNADKQVATLELVEASANNWEILSEPETPEAQFKLTPGESS